MAIDVTSVRTLLAVNGIGPDSTDDEKSKILAAAKYTPEEITSALALLSQPPAPRPSTITIPKKEKIPEHMRVASYPSVAPVVTEHPVAGSMLKLLLGLLFLLVVGASLYVSSALAYPASWLSMDVFCKGVPPASLEACLAGARPEASPWFPAAP